MTEIHGKRILVTGASGVLGGLIAQHLARAGAQLVLTGRDSAKLQQLGIDAQMYTMDLSIPGAGSSLIRTVTAEGPLDGVIIAHGVVAFGAAADLDTPTLLKLMETNLTSPIEILTSSHSALQASAQAGNEPFAVTISGVIADMPTASMAAYGASKAGLKAFVSALQREWRREGISVLDARPPHTETGLAQRAISGVAPQMPQGLSPQAVSERIVQAIVAKEKDLPANLFG